LRGSERLLFGGAGKGNCPAHFRMEGIAEHLTPVLVKKPNATVELEHTLKPSAF
jgi:hypothetical protein